MDRGKPSGCFESQCSRLGCEHGGRQLKWEIGHCVADRSDRLSRSFEMDQELFLYLISIECIPFSFAQHITYNTLKVFR